MKRGRRGAWPITGGLLLLLAGAIGVLLLLLWTISFRLRPALLTIATDHLSNQISQQICQVVEQQLEQEQITYDSICSVQWDSSGSIAALQTDMTRLHRLSSAVTTQVAQEFDDGLIDHTVSIPLGSLLPGLMLSGRGPALSVKVLAVGNISASFDNDFSASGINQTLHRVLLTVSVQLTLMLPGGKCDYQEDTQIILAETILLGQVPEQYVNFQEKSEE